MSTLTICYCHGVMGVAANDLEPYRHPLSSSFCMLSLTGNMVFCDEAGYFCDYQELLQ
jgi:hypothetical protein